MMIVGEGVHDGTMMTEMIVVDVGVAREITEMIIRDKVPLALTETRESIEDVDRPRLMRMRTVRLLLNLHMNNL